MLRDLNLFKIKIQILRIKFLSMKMILIIVMATNFKNWMMDQYIKESLSKSTNYKWLIQFNWCNLSNFKWHGVQALNQIKIRKETFIWAISLHKNWMNKKFFHLMNISFINFFHSHCSSAWQLFWLIKKMQTISWIMI